MLINFTVGNYFSFRDNKTLSMEATAIQEHKEYVKTRGKLKLLPAAVLYGANSSGKSNFIMAFATFIRLIITSSKSNSIDKLDVTPFLLSEDSEVMPTTFEIELLIGLDIFRYGFTVDKECIHEEWLYRKVEGKGREKCLFNRANGDIQITKYFAEGKNLADKTRDNALFLSVVDSFNGEISKQVIGGINSIIVISGINHSGWSPLLGRMCDLKGNFHEELDKFFVMMDVGFKKFEVPDDPKVVEQVKAYTYHNKYDKDKQIVGEVRLNMLEHESAGTNKLYDIASILLCARVCKLTLIIDELDSKLHPILTKKIVELFHKTEQENDAQLIFATHDTNLLSNKIFRRDQIWFVEKDKCEGSDLYSLIEFKEPVGTKIRNDRSYEKDYINGRYGAIPYVKD